ncbi:MAG: FAD-binding protein [Christensenellales bacterium]|jgi:succinate dehydrogenase/fumarate reductase flavoprotein subunit
MKRILTMCVLLMVLLSCTLGTQASSSSWVRQVGNVTWDEEVDFVIAGYGMAGSAAAIEAKLVAPEAKLKIFEKAPPIAAGGNAIASGQCILFPKIEDIDTFKTYFKNLNYPQTLPEEEFHWITEEMANQLPWVEAIAELGGYELGHPAGGSLRIGSMVIEFEDIEGSNFLGATGHLRKSDGGKVFEDGGCWNAMESAGKALGVEVEYETPVIALVQDPISTEILGVIARKPDGTEIAVRSKLGVLIATGGYAANMEMLANYNGGDQIMSAGSPYCTGDGFKMLASIGAQMWHVDNHTMSCGYFNGIKVPEYPTTFIRQFYPKAWNWIEVAADSTRFYEETKSYQRQHMKYKEHGQYIDVPIYKSMPVTFVFDETMRTTGGPIVNDWIGWPTTSRDKYKWSEDNAAEIEKGWIIKADTIEELAVKLGREPDALKATIDRWNEMCEKGVDEDFGRPADKLGKIETAPYYAVNMNPTLPATSGGAKRDIYSRVLNWDDEPIPGVYEAGELGSFVCNLYQNGTYLAEAIMSGRAAINTAFGKRSDIVPKQPKGLSNPWDGKEDGDYSAIVTGLHDSFEVIYTLKEGKLSGIRIGNNRDQMFMTDEQFSQYTNALIEAQSLGVDSISGATIDSQAIASGLINAFKKPPINK